MTKRPARPVFADIVAEVLKLPAPPPVAAPVLIAPEGSHFYEVAELTPAGALDLITAGARLAWDSCGSFGYAAEIEWFDPADRPRLVETGPPTLRNEERGEGSLTYWRSADGQALVLASYDVRWGEFMY